MRAYRWLMVSALTHTLPSGTGEKSGATRADLQHTGREIDAIPPGWNATTL
jgi:hypothetical protein